MAIKAAVATVWWIHVSTSSW